jgi:hypothetical protein
MENNMKGILPESEQFEFMGVTYVQTPLTLSRTGKLMGIGGEALFTALSNASQINGDESGPSERDMIIGFLAFLRQKSEVLPEVACILAGAETPEQVDTLMKHADLKVTTKIVRIFIKQNDVAQLKKDFLDLWAELKTSLGLEEPSKKTS